MRRLIYFLHYLPHFDASPHQNVVRGVFFIFFWPKCSTFDFHHLWYQPNRHKKAFHFNEKLHWNQFPLHLVFNEPNTEQIFKFITLLFFHVINMCLINNTVCLQFTDANACKEQREPTWWIHVPRWLEGLGWLLWQFGSGWEWQSQAACSSMKNRAEWQHIALKAKTP